MMTDRRHDIDWLRVIAIGLLLLYHITIIFQPWAMFLGFIRSNEQLEWLWKPMTMLNVWRIPLLFYISGMGVYFAIRKRSLLQLIMERSQRILIPFLFGMVAIVPLHFFIFQEYYNLPLSYVAHPGHLWFLGNIFIYVVLLSPLFFYLKKVENGRFRKMASAILANPLGPILISLLFVLEVGIVRPDLYELYVLTWHGFFLGLIAFFLGFLFVYCGPAFWETVLRWKWLYIGLAALLFAIRLYIFNTKAPGYLTAIESSMWIYGIFGLGYKYLNKPGHMLTYLSKAAYPVYIIHMIALYAGAALILPLAIPAFAKFLLVIVFTALFCYVVYEFLIRRIGILRPLFGLKRAPVEKPMVVGKLSFRLENKESKPKPG